jgi:hypothetical protein
VSAPESHGIQDMAFWQLVVNRLLDSSQDCIVFFVEALENLVDISLPRCKERHIKAHPMVNFE